MKFTCPVCGYFNSEKKIRSNPQNRYYHGVVVPILSEFLGYTNEEMHEVLKHKFLRLMAFFPTKSGGENVWITKSTADLDTKCFEEYLSQIRIWASSEIGCYIPDPGGTQND